ncbi:MAG: hypothetical protein FWG15_00955 [Propionibacteriaceae bacterium]|nr:hypothetical protein [Propionibacteriaceae bacterium]
MKLLADILPDDFSRELDIPQFIKWKKSVRLREMTIGIVLGFSVGAAAGLLLERDSGAYGLLMYGLGMVGLLALTAVLFISFSRQNKLGVSVQEIQEALRHSHQRRNPTNVPLP